MTLFDYLDAHPFWGMVYLIIIVLGIAFAADNLGPFTKVKEDDHSTNNTYLQPPRDPDDSP